MYKNMAQHDIENKVDTPMKFPYAMSEETREVESLKIDWHLVEKLRLG
jgi:hypothetical protein